MNQDTELDAMIRRSSPPAGVVDHCIDPEEFDAGRLVNLRAGALSPEAQDAVEAHLTACAFCRGMLRGLASAPSAALDLRVEALFPAAPPAVRPNRWLAIGGVLAAAAVFISVAFLMRAPVVALPDYEVSAFGGAQAQTRSEDATTERQTFRADSQVRFVLRPRQTLGTAPPPARAFVQRPGSSALVALPATLLVETPDGAKVLEASGRALFGDAPGAAVLIVAVGAEASALDALAGRPADADAPPGVALFRKAVDYLLE